MYGQMPAFLAYRAIFIISHSMFVIYILVVLGRKIYNEGFEKFQRSTPSRIFTLGVLLSTFRILEYAIDPTFLYHILPYWGRYLILWLVSVIALEPDASICLHLLNNPPSLAIFCSGIMDWLQRLRVDFALVGQARLNREIARSAKETRHGSHLPLLLFYCAHGCGGGHHFVEGEVFKQCRIAFAECESPGLLPLLFSFFS